jgi:AraC-like DNA-binding protein
VVDLVAAWLARELEAEAEMPDDARRRARMESIRAFIRRNLHDPELSPAVIAAEHHISVSYLHRVFTQQSGGETVAAWIRSQRLESARRDLGDPALCTMPIHSVATRWGIPAPPTSAAPSRARTASRPASIGTGPCPGARVSK